MALLALGLGWCLRAQIPSTYTIIHTGTLANCAPIVAGQTQSCYAVEGIAVSIKGAPYVLVPLSAAVTGVTSWNGQTGAVTYAPPAAPVSSVNGKTGAVVLSATTQLQ